MSNLNLGKLNGPIMIFGGPYSNFAATRAIYDQARKLNIPAGNIICTGDIVAYCGEPNETIEFIRDRGIRVVMGNCEESLAANTGDCGCGFEQGTTCSVLSMKWFEYANAIIKDDHRRWMANLPRAITFQYAGFNCRAIHASVDSMNRFVFESGSLVDKSAQLREVDADVIIGGHSGIPFGQKVAAGYWLNAGVIGMPANDGSAQTWFMLLETDESDVTASWHKLDYEAGTSQQTTLAAGMPEYAQALLDGLWPGQEVLPHWERQQCGRPLKPLSLALL